MTLGRCEFIGCKREAVTTIEDEYVSLPDGDSVTVPHSYCASCLRFIVENTSAWEGVEP